MVKKCLIESLFEFTWGKSLPFNVSFIKFFPVRKWKFIIWRKSLRLSERIFVWFLWFHLFECFYLFFNLFELFFAERTWLTFPDLILAILALRRMFVFFMFAFSTHHFKLVSVYFYFLGRLYFVSAFLADFHFYTSIHMRFLE